jgi:hypothetical protein
MTIPNDAPKKRGRKPLGDAAMSTAERQRRRREQLRMEGAKGFLLELEGLHLQHVEAMANFQGLTAAATVRLLVSNALDRYVGVMRRAERMAELGATDEVCAEFVREHLYPKLPPMALKKVNKNEPF